MTSIIWRARRLVAVALPAFLALLACGPPAAETTTAEGSPPADETPQPEAGAGGPANPPAPGFDLEGSDAEAIAVADRVMEAMGGRQAWDATRFLRWRFFGRRLHVWDKHSGDLRIEAADSEDRPLVILMNLGSGEGRVWRSGAEILDPAERAELLETGEAWWINDSYWVFMPYKLKDTGVTLRYVGEGALEDGRRAEVLELTFEAVGRTPENKYHVYVAGESGLVEQWDYYADARDEEPRIRTPWRDWRRFGPILLSDDRGERGHTELAVFDDLPRTVFTDPAPVDWSSLEEASK